MSAKAERLAKLEALECYFTWQINRNDILDPHRLVEKISEKIKCTDTRKVPTYCHVLAYLNYLLGENGLAMGFLSKAEKTLRDRKDDTELLVTYGNYAWLHYHCGNMEEVDSYLSKVADIQKAHPITSERPCRLPLIHGEKGWFFRQLGTSFYQQAQKSFEEALKEELDNISFNSGLAVVLYRLEGIEKSIEEGRSQRVTSQLEKALRLEPDNAMLMVLLALKLQWNSHEKQRSEELVEGALLRAPDDPRVTRYIAKYFRMQGRVDEALLLLNKALKAVPISSFIHHHIGLCHKQLLSQLQKKGAPEKEITSKQYECIHHLLEAVELKPSNLYARLDLAETYADCDQNEKAEEEFSKILEEDLREPDHQQVLVNYGVFLLYKIKNKFEAVRQLQAAYRIPVQSRSREKAGKKLKQLAANRTGYRSAESDRILQFLEEEDEKLRAKVKEDGHTVYEAASSRAREAADNIDGLTETFGKGMKLN